MRLPSEVELHGHYLEFLCLEGWDHRSIYERAERVAAKTGLTLDVQYDAYVARLLYELEAIKRQGFVGYTLLVHDLVSWCRRQGIMVGPGRGSSAGSLVYYLLGITSVDPIEHRLLFERFISEGRTDSPDVDIDFQDDRRDEIVGYLREKYGAENVAQIATVAQLKGKSCLKDVARVFDVPFEEVNKVTSAIITRAPGDERAFNTVEDSFKESEAAAEFARQHPEVYQFTVMAEGLHRQMGMHAAGVVVSPVPVTDVAPIETKTEDGVQTKFISVDKDGVEQLGLLKLDVLGLKTLTQLKATLRAVEERRHVALDLERLEFDDRRVLKRFTGQEFVGVFQFDSSSVQKLSEGVSFDSFDDLVAMNALNRPGTTRTGVADLWAKRRMGQDEVRSIHPVIDEILKDTEGIILYQEQASRIFIEVGGYTPAEADKVRKLGSKSKGVELVGKEEPKFVAGAVAKGFDEAVVRSLFNVLKGGGAYQFNRSHSAAYAAISYWQMYLKHYYPTEFMWALLRNEDEMESLTRYAKEAERLGIQVLPPDLNASSLDWAIADDKIIVAPLANIMGVGESAAKDLAKKRPFASLADLFARADRRLVNRRVLVALALADALRSLLPNKRAFVECAEKICGAREPAKAYEAILTDWAVRGEPDYDEEEAIIQRSRVCPMAMGVHPLRAYEDTVSAMGQHVAPERFDDVRWDGQVGFFVGMVTNTKVSRLNEKTDKSYAHLALEDEAGHQLRVKVEPRVYERHRYIIADRGVGTCVAVAAIKWKDETAKLCYMVDLEDLRQARKKGEPWQGQAAWFAESPVLKHGAPAADINAVLAKKMPRPGGMVSLTAMVVALKEHKDRRRQDMAFFDLAGYQGSVGALCFASSYGTYQGVLEPGTVVKIELIRGDKRSWILDADKGCHLTVLEKPPANSAG